MLDNGLTDIVTERYDAGVRMGEHLAKDMISARIGPDFRLAVVGRHPTSPTTRNPHIQKTSSATPASISAFPAPAVSTHGNSRRDGREIKIRVDGQLAFNNIFNTLEAALDGFGLAYVPEEIILYLCRGRTACPRPPEMVALLGGYHLYYPSRRQSSPAFVALVEALRHRE